MGIIPSAKGNTFMDMVAHILFHVIRRVASVTSGGMDRLLYKGAVISSITVTGLTHQN
jgi:hypothetical protein